MLLYMTREYTAGLRWGIFFNLDVNLNVLQGWYIFNAKLLSMLTVYNYLIWFDYYYFLVLINSFITNPGY